MPCQTPFRGDTSQMLLFKIASCLADGGFVAGVSSFNGFTGAVTFTGADIIALLGCTPACEGDVVNSFNTRVGDVTLIASDVTAVVDDIYVNESGDAMTGALSIDNGVLLASAPVLSLSQTWNNAAVAFTAFQSNVTATAAAAGSLLFNFLQGGVSVLNLRTDGRFQLTGRIAATTISSIGHSVNTSDALNTAIVNVLTVGHTLSAGVGAAGLGARIDVVGDTATVLTQTMFRLDASWVDPVQATRTALASFIVPVSGTLQPILVLSNNQTRLRDGTAAIPTLTFQSDLDLGLYRIAANSLGISAGGVLVAAFTDTTGITFSTSFSLPYVAKVATYTASAVDYTIDCTAGTFTINLPTAVGITGRVYVIKNSGVGTITVDPAGAELIDGLATQAIVSGAALMVQSTGTGWIII